MSSLGKSERYDMRDEVRDALPKAFFRIPKIGSCLGVWILLFGYAFFGGDPLRAATAEDEQWSATDSPNKNEES